ncbi:MAG TPA: VanW family protein [Clostridia bacterium]|nr:VanW family protein [Clostridia bacterium]
MVKNRKTPLIFLLIAIQSTLAVIAGVAVLYSESMSRVPAGVNVDGISVGNKPYSKAITEIESAYTDKLKSDSLILDIEGSTPVKVPFSQIGAAIDGNATLQPLSSLKSAREIPELLDFYFTSKNKDIRPVIKYDEGKLRTVLAELSEKLYIKPENADISFKDGTVRKKADTSGLKLNVNNAADIIRKQLSVEPWKPVALTKLNNYVLQTVNADITMKDFDDIQQVLGEYTTEISDGELGDSIVTAVDSINGTIIPQKSEKNSVFSFVEKLKEKDSNFNNDNEGYDQVASTLYAAMLTAGLPKDSIKRTPHTLAPDYIEPGLDSWISGDSDDLRLSNPYPNKLAIFARTDGNSVTVVIAGSMGNKKEDCSISTEVIQRYTPAVYYVENSSLKSGEKIVLNPGREGITINVLRNGELISTDQYEAEKSIVQIAPGTDWENDNK